HVTEDVPVPELRDNDQRELFEIDRRMMAKNPADRFQDAEHLAKVLEGKASVPSTPLASAPTVAMRAAPTTISGPQKVTSASTPTTPMPRTDVRPPVPKSAKRRGGGVLVGMFMLVLLGGGGGWFYYSNPQQVRSLLGLGGKSRPDSVKVLASADSAVKHDSVARADSAHKDST